jgi:cytochrome c556
MKKLVKRTLLCTVAVATLAFSLGLQAQQAKPEQVIKWRQSTMQVLGWNLGRIKGGVDGAYNKDEVLKASSNIAALANGGLGGLFIAGTETGKGWHETAVKPELFAAGSKAGDYAANLAKEASAMASVAATGDQAAAKAQFGKLGGTCKACHDDYRAKD